MRVAILQRVCTSYRVPLFQQLSKDDTIDFHLFIGENIPFSKVKNCSILDGIKYSRLKTFFVKIRGFYFPIHINLIYSLIKFNPNVILCEGESNFIGYIQAIFYRTFFNKNCKLIHWCFIELPGEDISKRNTINLIKRNFRKFFNGFLVYSSYSKKRLLEFGGVLEEKIFVATNVGNVEKMLVEHSNYPLTKSEAREKLNLKNNFTVLYLGTLDENKKPNIILDLASRLNCLNFNFIIAGDGPLYAELKERVYTQNLKNVFLTGRITHDLNDYIKASDMLIMPGRGGIAISEALAFGIPVVLHQADGTEYDLIQNGKTGYILENNNLDTFEHSILKIYNLSDSERSEMSKACQHLVSSQFNTKNMVNQIINAVLTITN